MCVDAMLMLLARQAVEGTTIVSGTAAWHMHMLSTEFAALPRGFSLSCWCYDLVVNSQNCFTTLSDMQPKPLSKSWRASS